MSKSSPGSNGRSAALASDARVRAEQAHVPQLAVARDAAVTVSWELKDVLLYALAVGAGPDGELDFLWEGRGPKVLPTFAVAQSLKALPGLFQTKFNPLKVLHLAQSTRQERELPSQATVTMTGRVSNVWDRGVAAILEIEAVGTDVSGPLFSTRTALLVRGEGRFGGERDPATPQNRPLDRSPDLVVSQATDCRQAALYRLCGDLNPLHIDPVVAAYAGFERPILHGLCTFGYVGRAVLRELCDGDPARFISLEGRFANPIYPGDDITTRIWLESEVSAIVQSVRGDGRTVLSQSRAEFR